MSRRPLCLAALLFAVWIIIMKLAGMYETASLPDSMKDASIRVRGQVYRQEKKNSNLIYLKNNSILSGNKLRSYNSNILVYTKEETEYEIGNILTVTGSCATLEKPGNPGQFDMASWYQVQNIGLVLTRGKASLFDGKKDAFMQSISRLKSTLEESFYKIAPEKEASLLCAMVLGEKAGADEEIKNLYQMSGIAHVLAISGLHISMLGMLLFQCIRRGGASFGVAGIISGALMAGYCVMTGMGVSTLRAFLMFLVYLGAQIFGRTYDLKSALGFSVLCILMENPLWLFQGGFQLSVLAVGGLAFLHPILKERLSIFGKKGEGLLVSISVQLAIFPCILYHFFEFPSWGIFLNLLILPCMSALLLFGIASCLLGIFSVTAGVFVFAPCHYILLFYETLCKGSIRLPGALQVWGRPSWWGLVIYYGILVAGCLSFSRKSQKKGDLLIFGILLMLGVAGLRAPKAKELEMTFLDVGQGDSIFWRTKKGSTFLCDGGSSSVSEVGRYRIEPFLKSQGVGDLDYLFLTHMDEDHINGAIELLGEEEGGINIGCVVLPDISQKDERYLEIEKLAKARGIPLRKIHGGMAMQEEPLEIRCLEPGKGSTGEEKNADSVVLALQYGEFRALLTGDLEGTGEEDLIQKETAGKLTVLKVAHHGSKGSTQEAFLKQTLPEISVISCGEGNSYGHPHRELLDRLKAVKTRIFMTPDGGAVKIKTDGKTHFIQTYKKLP